MNITESGCRYCNADLRDGRYTKRIAIIDPDLDCCVAYRCPYCGAEEPRSRAEILAVADPAAFRD